MIYNNCKKTKMNNNNIEHKKPNTSRILTPSGQSDLLQL